MLWTIFREAVQGKSLSRTLQNSALSKLRLAGRGIDLGSKSRSASYYRFIQLDNDATIQFTDLHPQEAGVAKVDLQKTFPFQDHTFDFVLLNNVLEHLFDYRICLAESQRILRPGGQLLGVVPFLNQIHYDPDDFYRYTESALRRLLTDSGFRNIQVDSLGLGPLSVGASMVAPLLRLGPMVGLCYLSAALGDRVLNALSPSSPLTQAKLFPLSYFFMGVK